MQIRAKRAPPGSSIQAEGLPALLRYTEQLDGAKLSHESMRVSADELAEAGRGLEAAAVAADPDQLRVLHAAVADQFRHHELLRGGGSVGGEQSGHIILPEISFAGDGMVTALNVAVAQKFYEVCKFVVANEFGQALDIKATDDCLERLSHFSLSIIAIY